MTLLALGQSGEAADQAEQAVQRFRPYFDRCPLALAYPMAVLARQAEVALRSAGRLVPESIRALNSGLERLASGEVLEQEPAVPQTSALDEPATPPVKGRKADRRTPEPPVRGQRTVTRRRIAGE